MVETSLKEKILKAKQENPTWGYKKLSKLLGIHRLKIAYYLSSQIRSSITRRTKKHRKNKPLNRKVSRFINKIANNGIEAKNNKFFFTKQLEDKIGADPRCYLTGKLINLKKRSTYHLDHKIPISRGGSNSLENCGLTCKEANQAKHAMTPDEFIELCKDVLKHNGYNVSKK